MRSEFQFFIVETKKTSSVAVTHPSSITNLNNNVLSNEEKNELNRLCVEYDVQPQQKDSHLSDIFPVRQNQNNTKETDEDGIKEFEKKTIEHPLARLQGLKTSEEKYKQILSQIRVRISY